VTMPCIFELLVYSKAEEQRVRRAAWRLKEAVELGRRSAIEEYVKALANLLLEPVPIRLRGLHQLPKEHRRVATPR
jgi:hypothetical protein